jgi:hypothetical protein
VNSSGIYYNKKDWNWQTSLTTRAALAWQPVDKLKFELAFLHSFVKGDGGPLVNPDFAGGASPLDATEILPAGSKYSNFTRIDELTRNTNLISLDASYDAGFATLSSTTSIQTTTGHTLEDNTYDLAGIHDGAYLAYYAGIPANPRFVYDQNQRPLAHVLAGSAPRLQGRAEQADRLHAGRVLPAPDPHRCLDHCGSRLARAVVAQAARARAMPGRRRPNASSSPIRRTSTSSRSTPSASPTSRSMAN